MTVAIVTSEAELDFVDVVSNSAKGPVIGTLDYELAVPSNPSVNSGLQITGARVITRTR